MSKPAINQKPKEHKPSPEFLNKDKKTSFGGLTGAIYNLTANCIDDYGNEQNKTKSYVFDLEQGIDIIYPTDSINKNVISPLY